MVCAVCGKTPGEVNEWRPCPKYDGKLVCGSEHCFACEYWRTEEFKGDRWCMYHIGKQAISDESKMQALMQRQNILSNQIRQAYRNNWPRKAQQLEFELLRVTRKIRSLQKGEAI